MACNSPFSHPCTWQAYPINCSFPFLRSWMWLQNSSHNSLQETSTINIWPALAVEITTVSYPHPRWIPTLLQHWSSILKHLTIYLNFNSSWYPPTTFNKFLALCSMKKQVQEYNSIFHMEAPICWWLWWLSKLVWGTFVFLLTVDSTCLLWYLSSFPWKLCKTKAL